MTICIFFTYLNSEYMLFLFIDLIINQLVFLGMKCKFNSNTFKETQIYQIYDGESQNKQKVFLQIFIRKKLLSYGIDQNIQHNISTFQEINDAAFPQSFLNIYDISSTVQAHKIVSQSYADNLLQYILHKQIKQKQALQIFSYVLKAVYSLILIGVKPVNVRPQHFVKVKNSWKLKCLVMDTEISRTQGLSSEYLWSPSYQAPQQYINSGKQQLQDQDLKLVVWNLGSILLDLLMSRHVLKNQQIIRQFQNKEFSFDLLKGNKVHQISSQTKKIVCEMLHYNPKQRTIIQKIFQNIKLSQEVAQHFQSIADGKSDVTIQEVQLKMTQKLSESVKSSLLKSKTNKSKIQQTKEDLPKNFAKKLQKINEQENEIASIMGKKDTQIVDDDFFMNSLDLISNKIQKRHVTFNKDMNTQIIYSQESQLLPKQESFFQNQKFRKIFQIYKTFLDRSQLLFVTSHKFSQIPFQTQADQLILLSKYAVYFVGLMNLNNMVLATNHNKNIYKIDSYLFSQFIESIQYKSFKMYINAIFQKKQTIFQRLKLELEDFNVNKKNLLKTNQIMEFCFESSFRSKQFNQVKTAYRKILKKSYDCITKKYNSEKGESIGRLGMYVVSCMTVDKLYQQNDIQKNFSFFFQWANKPASKYVNISLFQKYLDQANIGILIKHARYVLETYFNV